MKISCTSNLFILYICVCLALDSGILVISDYSSLRVSYSADPGVGGFRFVMLFFSQYICCASVCVDRERRAYVEEHADVL